MTHQLRRGQCAPLIDHREAASQLRISPLLLERGIRGGTILFCHYHRAARWDPWGGVSRDVWCLESSTVEDLREAIKQTGLEIPEEFRFGLRQVLYNRPLRVARLRCGLTQGQLAELVQVAGKAITAFETFRSYPKPQVAQAIAEVLSVGVEVLFPAWLKECRRKRTPSILTDAHFSLDEALALGRIDPETMCVESQTTPFMLPSPEDEVERSDLQQKLGEVLHTLTPRERRVLIIRFGLEDGQSRTLEEIGQSLGVTRECIRQIESKALRKLRHPSQSRKLKGFID